MAAVATGAVGDGLVGVGVPPGPGAPPVGVATGRPCTPGAPGVGAITVPPTPTLTRAVNLVEGIGHVRGIGILQGDDFDGDFRLGTELLNELDQIDNLLDVLRVGPTDDDDAQLAQAFPRPPGRAAARVGGCPGGGPPGGGCPGSGCWNWTS